MTRMPEVGAEIPQMFNLEGKLGTMPRLSGTDSFTQVFDAFVTRAKQDSAYIESLKTITETAHSSKDDVASDIRYGRFDEKHPEVLSERLLGKWVGLAAEKALLNLKGPLSESEGARWIQLDGDVARLEDAILLLHRGKKGITLTQDAINVFADPKGDVQQKIVDSLTNVAAEMKRAGRRTAVKAGSVLVMGELILLSCTSHPEGGIITQVPTLNSNRPTVTEVMPTSAPEILTANAATQVLEAWKTFTVGKNTFESVGAPTFVTEETDKTVLITLGAVDVVGIVNSDTQYGFGWRQVKDASGKTFSLPFELEMQGQKVTAKALFLDTQLSSADRDVFQVGRVDAQGNLTMDGTKVAFIRGANGDKMVLVDAQGKETELGLVAPAGQPPSPDPTALPLDTFNIVFHTGGDLLPTPTPDSTPTATKEPEIGGTTAVILWKDYYKRSTVPSEFAPYLVPTTPEQWKSLDTLTMSDGKPIPLGGAITYLEVGDPFGKWPVIPGLVRGVVEHGTYAGKPTYGAILEFPVKGGSVFYVALLDASNTNAYLPTSQLIPGAYPVECTGGVVCKGEQVYVTIKKGYSIPINDPDMVSLLQRLTGTMALFPMRPIPEHQAIVKAIANGSLSAGETQYALSPPEIWYQP